jgi:hypothetical protein
MDDSKYEVLSDASREADLEVTKDLEYVHILSPKFMTKP